MKPEGQMAEHSVRRHVSGQCVQPSADTRPAPAKIRKMA